MQPRTKRQKEVLDFITRFLANNGHKPSYQQIARHLGVSSKAGVARHIQALEHQGLISRRRENGSFGLELPSGRVAADTVCKIEFLDLAYVDGVATDWFRSHFAVPKLLIGGLMPEDVFAFRCKDDSMIDKHILESDIVLLERRSYARRGDVVVALAEEKQMLFGQFYQSGTETEIRPANTYFEPVVIAADKVIVQGVMRGLLRPLPMHEN
jgi:repressor LexA